MITLASLLTDQMIATGDTDMTPIGFTSEVCEDLSIDPDLELPNKISILLESENMLQNIWAIMNIKKLYDSNADITKFIPYLVNSLSSRFLEIEFVTIMTVNYLLENDPAKFSESFSQIIFERILDIPAEEYVKSIEFMIPFFSTNFINDKLVTLISDLFESEKKSHFAACRLLLLLPVPNVFIPKCTFNHFIQNHVLISQFLSPIAQKFTLIYGDEWIRTELPRIILLLSETDNTLNIGFYTFLVNNLVHVDQKYYCHIYSAIEYARNNEETALALFEKCENLVNSQFMNDLYKLLDYCVLSPSVAFRIRVVDIVSKKSALLNDSKSNMKIILNRMCNDPHENVRAEFVNKAPALFAKLDNEKMKDYLFTLFLGRFQDKSQLVIGKLPNVYLLPEIAKRRTPLIMNNILPVMVKLQSNWRNFSTMLSALESFPIDHINSYFSQIFDVIEGAVRIHADALKMHVSRFFACCMNSFLHQTKVTVFLSLLCEKYAKSENYKLRVLYFSIMTKLLEFTPYELYHEMLINHLKCFCFEKVEIVIESILNYVSFYVTHYGQYLAQKNINEMRQFISTFKYLCANELSRVMYERAEEACDMCPVLAKRSVSIDKLPNLRPDSVAKTLTLTKAAKKMTDELFKIRLVNENKKSLSCTRHLGIPRLRRKSMKY